MVFGEVENDCFFDSLDCLSSEASIETEGEFECDIGKSPYEIWLNEPQSVKERRHRFLREMGLGEFVSGNDGIDGFDRITECSEAVLSSSIYCTSRAQDSACCGWEAYCEASSMVDLDHDQLDKANVARGDVNSRSALSMQECQRQDRRSHSYGKKKLKSWWKQFVNRRKESRERFVCDDILKLKHEKPRINRVKVKHNNKRCTEFTGVYMDQEIRAHNGLIHSMKFSPGGKYLATGGEDRIVRVWQVTDVDASHKNFDFGGYFSKNKTRHVSVIIPEKVFRVQESPLQELHGHTGDVLDLAWSTSNNLLSASTDKTVRMWKVGCNTCLNVFQHSNYVSCIQFNPIDENYFISGSIDGKVRVWGVSEKRVVNWADAQGVLSAICYKPDGKGMVVGDVSGTCRFYKESGHDLQLEAEVRSKRKAFKKRITGIQLSHENSRRVVITSEDSYIRVFDGVDLIHKFKGLSDSGSQMSASFTSTGRHLVSVGEDSRVYLWNYDDLQIKSSPKHGKTMRSFEHFLSSDTYIAISWPGTTAKNPNPLVCSSSHVRRAEGGIGSWLFLDCPCTCRGASSITWPEEKLPLWDIGIDQIGQRRICSNNLNTLSEAWGLVIVTAGRDGTIRTFHNYGLPTRM